MERKKGCCCGWKYLTCKYLKLSNRFEELKISWEFSNILKHYDRFTRSLRFTSLLKFNKPSEALHDVLLLKVFLSFARSFLI